MPELSRRRLLIRTSLGFGVVVAAVAARPSAVVAPSEPIAPFTGQNALPGASVADTASLEPMVIHVWDVATAEIAVLVGTQEFVHRDPELVARLVKTAKQTANTEG
jgi:hypothetical protein